MSPVFLYFSVMFCDNCTLNTVTVYNLLIFFSLVEVMKHHFSTQSYSAMQNVSWDIIYNIRKFSFKHMSYYKELS